MARILANRRNAQRSTGPRTPAGKAASSRNALKHGVYAKRLLSGEDPAEFDRFLASMMRELRPVGPAELKVAARAVVAAWRLERVAALEARAFTQAASRPAPPGSAPAGIAAAFVGRGPLNLSPIDRVIRLEASLGRVLARCLAELDRLRRRRAGLAPSRESAAHAPILIPPGGSTALK